MANRIIKIRYRNGTTYLYEDRSYWDKERGYSTHERKCIGKLGIRYEYTGEEVNAESVVPADL